MAPEPNSNTVVAQHVKSINSKFPIPHPLWVPFANPPLRAIDATRIFGYPIEVDAIDSRGNPKKLNSLFLKDNLSFGATWAIISGYTSNAFFKSPSPNSLFLENGTFSSFKSLYTRKWFRVSLIAKRVCRRVILGGLLFDFFEQKAAKMINRHHTSPTTVLVGLSVCMLAFPLTSHFVASGIYCTAIATGFIIGARLPALFFDEARRISEIKQQRSTYMKPERNK